MDFAPSACVDDFRESCSLGYNSEFLYTNNPPLPAFLRSCVVVGECCVPALLLCCAGLCFDGGGGGGGGETLRPVLWLC
jgi:hypothetical protein